MPAAPPTEYLDTLDDAAFGAATPVTAEVRSRRRSRRALVTAANRRPAHSSLLRPTISSTSRTRSSSTSRRPRRSGRPRTGGARHDRAHAGPLRPLPGTPGRRHRLRLGRDARLAGRRAGDRAAHPGDRQVAPRRRNVSAARTSSTTARRQPIAARPESELRQYRRAVPHRAQRRRRGRHRCATAPARSTATPAR